MAVPPRPPSSSIPVPDADEDRPGGRPGHAPDPQSQLLVASLTALGWPKALVARRLEISEDTLTRHYKAELEGAREFIVGSAFANLVRVGSLGTDAAAVRAAAQVIGALRPGFLSGDAEKDKRRGFTTEAMAQIWGLLGVRADSPTLPPILELAPEAPQPEAPQPEAAPDPEPAGPAPAPEAPPAPPAPPAPAGPETPTGATAAASPPRRKAATPAAKPAEGGETPAITLTTARRVRRVIRS